jgi:hypothetical protein
VRSIIAVSAVAVTLAGWAPGASAPASRELLRTLAGFTDGEWAAVERGDAVSKLLETDTREIAVVGAVRIAGDRERLAARFKDLDTLKGATVLDVGRFSAAPSPSDLSRVTFDDHNLDLRACQPGDCPVRLSAGDVGRFRREVNWQSGDWRNQSMTVWRSVLAVYAAAYAAKGRAGLPEYVNKRDPLSVAAEVLELTRHYGFVASYSPALHAYLNDFGPRAPAGAEQLLYWTREDFGIRPIYRISHQVIQRTVPATIIATNQVYADHYLDAALTVTLGVDAAPGFHMISISRARTRSLSGFMRRFARSTVQSRSREAMRRILASTKTAIERPNR